MERVQYSGFDTRGLAGERALACWLENIDILFDVQFPRKPEGDFHARAGGFRFGDLIVGQSETRAQAFERSRYRLARDGLSHFLIQFYDSGSCGPRAASASEWTRPGDMLIVDLAQPLQTAATDFSNLNILVPRRLLAPRLKDADAQHLRIVRRESPLVALLENHVRSLSKTIGSISAAQARLLVNPTLDLMAAALDGHGDERGNGASVALGLAIRRYLQSELTNLELSADMVAARFGISRRKLYYLFEDDGGFVACLTTMRLQAIRAALIDPGYSAISIADLAGRYGFRHRSSFIAAFRRVYGLAPREARAMALEGRADRYSPLHVQWRGWIPALR